MQQNRMLTSEVKTEHERREYPMPGTQADRQGGGRRRRMLTDAEMVSFGASARPNVQQHTAARSRGPEDDLACESALARRNLNRPAQAKKWCIPAIGVVSRLL